MLFDYLHSRGTIPSSSDMVNTCATGVLISSTVSFIILGDIPSTPRDLFSFMFLILVATTSGVTYNCPQPSPHVNLSFSGAGNAPVSSLVNTELKCKFNSSAFKIPSAILFQTLSSSGPTLS